jgi:hypothetical protein
VSAQLSRLSHQLNRAAAAMSEADAIISVWHAKYLYGSWRPITAIQLADTDGNPATTPTQTARRC